MKFTAFGYVIAFAPALAGGHANAGELLKEERLQVMTVAEAAVNAEAPAQLPPGSAPRAVTVARTTEMLECTLFVDAAASANGNGTAQRPHKTIAAAVRSEERRVGKEG